MLFLQTFTQCNAPHFRDVKESLRFTPSPPCLNPSTQLSWSWEGLVNAATKICSPAHLTSFKHLVTTERTTSCPRGVTQEHVGASPPQICYWKYVRDSCSEHFLLYCCGGFRFLLFPLDTLTSESSPGAAAGPCTHTHTQSLFSQNFPHNFKKARVWSFKSALVVLPHQDGYSNFTSWKQMEIP